jgi:hypothetical protein
VATLPGFPQTTAVILLDISAKDYSFSWLESDWRGVLVRRRCPNCRETGRFARHAVYRKYHFQAQIEILRVRCRGCRVTHALIPSFSLPGTSIGTAEAEAYLIARAEGVSRAKAASVLRAHGISEGYPKRLERMFAAAVQIGKALLSGMGEVERHGPAWVSSVCGHSDRPLYDINCFGLDHRLNGLCFCRRWLLKYGRIRVGGEASHNLGSALGRRVCVDSG